MKLRVLFAFLLLALACNAAAAGLTPAEMQADLHYLQDVCSHTDRSLTRERRIAFDAAVDQALAHTDSTGAR